MREGIARDDQDILESAQLFPFLIDNRFVEYFAEEDFTKKSHRKSLILIIPGWGMLMVRKGLSVIGYGGMPFNPP